MTGAPRARAAPPHRFKEKRAAGPHNAPQPRKSFSRSDYPGHERFQ